MSAPRSELAAELLRRLAAAVRSAQLYSEGHPLIGRNLDALVTAVQLLHALDATVVIGLVQDEFVVGGAPVGKASELAILAKRLQHHGIDRITIEPGVDTGQLNGFVAGLVGTAPLPSLLHIRVGRLSVAARTSGGATDAATMKRVYNDAVSVASDLWESASTEGMPDATAARKMVDGLAEAVSQNRTALLALTTLKNYDNYTFTHMVNVSVLTMGQARTLGIDGPLLREFGLAALMHDIGKVRTPLEVLNKPEKLNDAEFAIMKRHVVDGAEILRATPDMPALAPIMAFEHHLRIDGTGYPNGVQRTSLNLGTMLCSIADVYDAMRSQRAYQQAFPTDRILAVLKRNDGQQFDQHLVRRFVQLLGIYPVGNLVRLDTGHVAVVVHAHAPDPYRPHVRVLLDAGHQRLDTPYDLALWQVEAGSGQPSAIVEPLDPAAFDLDPLTLL